jgi:hypothetical protein
VNWYTTASVGNVAAAVVLKWQSTDGRLDQVALCARTLFWVGVRISGVWGRGSCFSFVYTFSDLLCCLLPLTQSTVQHINGDLMVQFIDGWECTALHALHPFLLNVRLVWCNSKKMVISSHSSFARQKPKEGTHYRIEMSPRPWTRADQAGFEIHLLLVFCVNWRLCGWVLCIVLLPCTSFPWTVATWIVEIKQRIVNVSQTQAIVWLALVWPPVQTSDETCED